MPCKFTLEVRDSAGSRANVWNVETSAHDGPVHTNHIWIHRRYRIQNNANDITHKKECSHIPRIGWCTWFNIQFLAEGQNGKSKEYGTLSWPYWVNENLEFTKDERVNHNLNVVLQHISITWNSTIKSRKTASLPLKVNPPRTLHIKIYWRTFLHISCTPNSTRIRHNNP